MNIFKREILVLIRSKIFIFIGPITLFISSISFNKDIIKLDSIMGLFPFSLAIFIPIVVAGTWIREIKISMDNFLLISNVPIVKILVEKIKLYIILFFLVVLSYFPVIYIYSLMGKIDFGLLFSIYVGILLLVVLAVNLTLFLSVIIKGLIPTIVSSSLILLILLLKVDFLSGFYSGSIDITIVLIICVISFLLLQLSVSIIEKKLYIFHIIISFLVMLISLFINLKFDTTSERKNSLDKNTISIIQELDKPVDIEYYYSESLLSESNLTLKIIDQLYQFGKLNKINIKFISDKEDNFGQFIRKFEPIKGENNRYSFIVVKYNNQYQVIPQIPYVETLEFEIIKVITYLKNGSLKKIGIYIGEENLTEDNFSVLSSILTEHFSIIKLFPGDTIPDDLDSLVIIGHYGINSIYTDEIGHYLSDGGNILIAGTGLPINEELIFRSTPILDSLKKIGVEIEPYLIGSSDNFNSYNLNINGYVNNKMEEHPIVKNFSLFTGMFTSPILVKNENFIDLIYSSNESWLVDGPTKIEGQPENRFSIAAYGEGSFSKFFTSHSSSKVNKMVVLGSNLGLTDYPYSLGYTENYNFIVRALYVLNGDNKLIDINNKFDNNNLYYKLIFNSYKTSIQNLFYLFTILFYPLTILLISFIIKKRMR